MFNEYVHAFIAARFYVRLTEAFPERGKAAYIHGVQHYAMQRGRRMAQRAIRDGKALTYETFMQYGELIESADVEPADGELISLSPDYVLHITSCPWHEQFERMGDLEAGSVYCRYLDEALCRGFNPELCFQAPQNLNAADYCIHKVLGTNYDSFPDAPPMKQYKKDFSYHCAHLYSALREVSTAIFGSEGAEIGEAVLTDVAEAYGAETAGQLQENSYLNFNIC